MWLILKLPASVASVNATSTAGPCSFEAAAARGKPTSRVLCLITADPGDGAATTATVAGTPTATGPLAVVARVKPAPGVPAVARSANNETSVSVTVTP